MYYTYIIESVSCPKQRYTGHTSDLRQRLHDHNQGRNPHTAKFLPWKIRFYAAFETIEQARHFESYLKSGSGHAIANRHIWTLPKQS
jgi:putative endonuclease